MKTLRSRSLCLATLLCTLSGLTSQVGQAQEAPKPQEPAKVPTKTPAPAEVAPSAPAPGSVSISGLFDWYFGVNARAPRAANGDPFSGTPTPRGETIRNDTSNGNVFIRFRCVGSGSDGRRN